MKIPLTFHRVATLALGLFATISHSSAADLPAGLILDLDADRGLTVEEGDRVAKWENQIRQFPAKDFVKRDQGRKEAGSGRPTSSAMSSWLYSSQIGSHLSRRPSSVWSKTKS